MSFTEFLFMIPGPPVVSIIIWLVLMITMLYLARTPAHRAIRSLTRTVHSGFRLAARSIQSAESRLMSRNKEVLLAAGREAVERQLEREFQRVNAVVKRDLSGYPALQRVIADQIIKIEDDYQQTTEIPPPPPTWVKVVESVAQIPAHGDPTVPHILEEIHKTIDRQYRTAMSAYRKNVGQRHDILAKMMPYWRKLNDRLAKVGKTISGLQARSQVIDNRMEHYEQILAKSDRAERMLSSSAMIQFVIAGFVLMIAAGGAIINFNLIALPMSEMVGGGSYIGQFRTADVAALVIILVEVAMGLYLMESLRITRMFPVIGSMDDRMRIRMIWITFGILFILASVESALAFMRDSIAADLHALRQSLSDVEATGPVNSWIPMVGQMAMGFILPFALTFVAIPLETFIGASRTVIGVVVGGLLRIGAFLLRLIGNIALHLGDLLVNVYDLLIVPPLWVERLIKDKGKPPEISPQEEIS